MADRTLKIAYVIVEATNGKTYWNRIGVGFVNRDGSINVKLDAFPVSGEFQLRDYVPREDYRGDGQESPRFGKSEPSDFRRSRPQVRREETAPAEPSGFGGAVDTGGTPDDDDIPF